MTMIPAGRPGILLAAGDARVVVSPADGGRIASVVVGDTELLVNEGETHPMQWGCYPMVPWAGRVRHGRFSFRGHEHQLPLGLPPHAIHGVAYDRPWQLDETAPDAVSLSIDLDQRWPFGGHVSQRVSLAPDGLESVLTLEATEPMPGMVGWHPWFRRQLVPGEAPALVRFSAREMLARDAEWMPSGERMPPSPGPWDDAFAGLQADPVIEWPGRLRLTLSSTCAWWVVYTMPEHALCVEPQSGPPDSFNGEPEIVRPGAPLSHVMRWRWTRG